MKAPSTNLFSECETLLKSRSTPFKIQGVDKLFKAWSDGAVSFKSVTTVNRSVIGGLPQGLVLVPPKALPRRRLTTLEGRAAMIHAIMHIEFNAINIALDALYRFRDMPLAYYEDWLRVAREEAYHFDLLSQHLATLGYQYGDFPAHNSLWEMTEKTAGDVLTRMALVPRLLEARGLDVTPQLAAKLQQAGDKRAAEILSIIYHDEITHVQVGNRWYHWLCKARGLAPMPTFVSLLEQYASDYLRGPLSMAVRRKAGFNDEELNYLNELLDKRAVGKDA